VRSGGVWTQRQKLTADDGAASDGFGFSLAISGDTVVVGARWDDTGEKMNQGSAYVFVRSGGVWTQRQKLTADDGAAGDFGFSMAVSGDTVVVGASIDTIGANSDQGSAHVFVRSGTVWTKQQKLTADDGPAGDQLGSSVAISGDTIVVGAPLGDIGDKFDQGSAYVFVRSGTVWTKQQKLTADDGEARDIFGISVALSGNTVVIGANVDKIGENIVQGSAYVFVRIGATWMKQQKLTADDGEVGDQLGSSVAISGDTVVVGAFGDKIGENFRQGSAYIFGSSACQFSVAPTNHVFSTQGGSGVVNVNADAGCAWTALSNDPFITIASGATGSGAGAVMFAVSQFLNPGSRRGTLTVAGREVRVAQAAPLTSVSAASFALGGLAAESIVAAFGSGLANGVEVAKTLPLPTTLGGARVSVVDSVGTERLAPLFFVSPNQINFEVPPGTAAGQALVTILRGEEITAAESPRIELVSPGLFSADASGHRLLAGVALRVKADGSQSFEPVVRFDNGQNQFVAEPIDLGPDQGTATDQVYLVMSATGLRNRSGLSNVSVKLGGVSAEAIYAGAQGTFEGLDQVNVLLPRSLAGRGQVDVKLTVDGQSANTVNVAFK
jgi:uncharacterized protein (TIGR03437 family)